ncbi:hypothetical protein C1645_732355 [Glomus cerebriforme]|uniref:Uncharacterized protein n=1 Tax=Glomus cerebriforme TaxID=658196 RepID=A0A397TM28_9GLOM|nr:hypothetical protein C1645_732355 [Glomus cerebriforme]
MSFLQYNDNCYDPNMIFPHYSLFEQKHDKFGCDHHENSYKTNIYDKYSSSPESSFNKFKTSKKYNYNSKFYIKNDFLSCNDSESDSDINLCDIFKDVSNVKDERVESDYEISSFEEESSEEESDDDYGSLIESYKNAQLENFFMEYNIPKDLCDLIRFYNEINDDDSTIGEYFVKEVEVFEKFEEEIEDGKEIFMHKYDIFLLTSSDDEDDIDIKMEL